MERNVEEGEEEIIAWLVNHYPILDAIGYSLRHLEWDYLFLCVWVSVFGGMRDEVFLLARRRDGKSLRCFEYSFVADARWGGFLGRSEMGILNGSGKRVWFFNQYFIAKWLVNHHIIWNVIGHYYNYFKYKFGSTFGVSSLFFTAIMRLSPFYSYHYGNEHSPVKEIPRSVPV